MELAQACRNEVGEKLVGHSWMSADDIGRIDRILDAVNDEMRSNCMNATLDHLKHRVTEVEAGVAEAIDGKVITALNEEAVVCACLGNKAGINLTVTYEAFAPKMLGALRQELIWSDHLLARGREPGWISVPLVMTSHAFENGKNERSHQDPAMCQAMLGEPSDVSRVLFPADHNSAMACIEACYRTRGRIFTLVVPKAETLPVLFDEVQAGRLVAEGALRLDWLGSAERQPPVLLTAIGAYQLGAALRERIYPEQWVHRVFACHARPDVMAGVLRHARHRRHVVRQPLVVRACARSMALDLMRLLDEFEIDALEGRRDPRGLIV